MSAENIETFLKDLFSYWQVARIYEIQHPQSQESLEKSYNSLEAVLAERQELVIGIFENELASGGNIFFDLSKKMTAVITNFKQRGIERIVFHRGLTKDELSKFISFLVMPPEEIKDQPQQYLSSLGVSNIVIGKIKGPLEVTKEKREGEGVQNLFNRYEDCLDNLSQSLSTLIDEDAVNYLNLRSVANNIMENLIGNYQIFFKLTQTKSHDITTFMHLLNVSILSIYFSHKLGFAKNDCLDIGTAALFHDIGKLYITRKIIQKPDDLDKTEFAKIKSHTVLGAEILLRHVDALTILPAVVAFEHHLGYNLSGYPKRFFLKKLHPASLIISICDVYDALTQRRSYKRDYPPEMVYMVMMRDRGSKFSPQLLDKFFKIMGVWPKGTVVVLEDDRVAIVRDVNEEDIFRPKVEIVSSKTKELIDLKETDENIKIKSSLNPFKEGKEYLDLI